MFLEDCLNYASLGFTARSSLSDIFSPGERGEVLGKCRF